MVLIDQKGISDEKSSDFGYSNYSNQAYRWMKYFDIKRFIYSYYEKRLLKSILKEKLPKHIGIIMDGNRRFAEKLGLPRHIGHKYGAEKLKEVLRWCWDLDIKYLTLYSFSTENFSRTKKEVDALMELFEKNFLKIANDPEVQEKNVKFKAIGRINLLSKKVQDAIREAEEKTKKNDGHLLQVAVSYGGRAEIVDAIKKIVNEVKNNKLNINEIDEKTVSNFLYTQGIPDPDVIIRTSGEERTSGFLLWQSSYSELIFLDVYFPSMRKIDLLRCIRIFQQRSRRFGK